MTDSGVPSVPSAIVSTGNGVEKTLFLFTRKGTRSCEDFANHYVNHHAVLGRRLTRSLIGYTVNIVRNRNWPDAVAEHWVRSAQDLLTPAISYATREDFEQVYRDDRSLFDGFRLYVVTSEHTVVDGHPPTTDLGSRSPGQKAVWRYSADDRLPAPPSWALRVVDNRVDRELVHAGDGTWQSKAPDVAVFRMAWACDRTTAVEDADLIVDEYRQLQAPDSFWSAADR